MKPGQELVILFFALFVGVVAIIIMLSVILNRLQKQKQHRCTVKHRRFYAMLPEFIGGQILFSCGNLDEMTGIIKEIRLNKETKNDNIDFSCLWTAESKESKWKWTPYFSKGLYFNVLKNYTLFDVDKAAIFELADKVVCLIMSNAQGVVFLYHPKDKHLIKIEDVEGYQVMLPATVKV